MADNEERDEHRQDRRLQTIVARLELEVNSLKTANAVQALEMAQLKGELNGLRSSSATSSEVKAGAELLNERLTNVSSTLSKDLNQIKSIMIWTAITVVGTLIAAFQFKIVAVVP